MRWTLKIARRAQKTIARAPAKSQRLLLAALEEMQQNPFSGDIASLTSERSSWRRRVGAFRIFFDVYVDEGYVDVVEISRRTSTTYQ